MDEKPQQNKSKTEPMGTNSLHHVYMPKMQKLCHSDFIKKS